MEKFLRFLKTDRELDDATLSAFREEKIDCYAINSMTDEQLQMYIPKFGDRIAIRLYCKREVAALEENPVVSKATGKTTPALHGKQAKKRKLTDNRSEKLCGNRNGQKTERCYQMGVFEEVRGSFVQIKVQRGGGTRQLKALKSTTMRELLEYGKKLFFPNGKNKLGHINEFELKLRDFTEKELDPQTTLGEQYEMRKVRMLRLYLSCKRTDTPRSESTETTGSESFQRGNTKLGDTPPMDPVEIVQVKPQATKLRLRKGNVFQDLNAAFTDGLISLYECLVDVEMVLPSGSTKKGEDNGGILRDALSEYWGTFFMNCTAGRTLRVPMTRHDMKDEWENVAKVIILGYNTVQYFPIVLAKPFLYYCLGLEIDEDELFAAFLEIVTQEEKQLVEEAMRDFTSVSGREEWAEFLDAHDVKLVITDNNAKQILLDVAHKEIVQDPAYIAECWSPILRELILPPGGLDELITSLNPTAKKVVAVLRHETLNQRENQIMGYLKRFIKNSSDVRLRKFLRFCTGADLLVAKFIHARFIQPKSFSTRGPQSHTCGCVLEVPNNYTSYLELAEEFANVLDADI
ncbi:uncharacterized protein LOC128519158 isoform X1 [Clarias gariepinus]|uniref:uncharacterized protein LOC128519158 isoform X1 n=2 Tax=Clarias gariepinus TaxID=13013 RepID=UPI00234C2ECC|nr:uncharacterized protein LOC128519158 isoform X1 [Clarias gariepinus]